MNKALLLFLVNLSAIAQESAGPLPGLWLPVESKPAFDVANSDRPSDACSMIVSDNPNNDGRGKKIITYSHRTLNIDVSGNILECDIESLGNCKQIEYRKIDTRTGKLTEFENFSCFAQFETTAADRMHFNGGCHAQFIEIDFFRVTEEQVQKYARVAKVCSAEAFRQSNRSRLH